MKNPNTPNVTKKFYDNKLSIIQRNAKKLKSHPVMSNVPGIQDQLDFLRSSHRRFIFGLPGNPVSVMICFEMYVRPLIMRRVGNKDLFRPVIRARASHGFKKVMGRTNFARVILTKKGSNYFFKSTGMQGSGILTSMVKADGIAVFPEDAGDIKKDSEEKVFYLKDK